MITLSNRQLCDLEMLLNGSFHPVHSYMNQADWKSVCEDMELSDGTFFPLPINLEVTESEVPALGTKIQVGNIILLCNQENLPLA